MAFSDSLKRLRAAANGQRGREDAGVLVDRHDLQQLLYHFDRVDGLARETALLQEVPQEVPAGVYGHRNGNRYVVTKVLKMKFVGQWIANGLTEYESVATRGEYARLTTDFLRSFTKG